ncbi:MAG TPA: M28 family peptidase [Pyrinomonadaceae bacterium]|nr:M28 family peptidase [Pyrinomonadaceae bacterium]
MTNDDVILSRTVPLTGFRRRHLLVKVVPGIVTLGFAACLGLLSILSLTPPAINANAPATEFSSARAGEYLKAIAAKPRPIGSPAHAAVRDYIFAELVEMGLQPQVQKTTAVNPNWEFSYRAATVHNIIAKLQGTANSRAVLLVAHYDAAPTSLGASDNGAAVVSLLETLRALKASAPLQNDVIFLATDGEEIGLLGAIAFVQQHPWAKDVGVVLNFEARGNHGPSIMFQTSDENDRLIGELAESVSRPVANSLSADIYKYLPNETDFTVFQKAGMNGLNFAYIEGVAAYHSSLDNISNLDERSLQHHGTYALALARTFGNSDLNAPISRSKAVYFDLFGRTLIHYSQTTALVLTTLVALVTFGVIGLGVRRGLLTLSGQAWGFLALLLSMIGASLLVMLAWWMVDAIAGSQTFFQQGDTWTNHLYLTGFVLLTVAITTLVCGLFRKKVSVENLATGALLWFLLLLIVSHIYFPGGSYLLAWPLLFATIAWILRFTLPAEKLSLTKLGFISAVCAVPGIILISPLAYQVFVATGISLTTVIVVPVTLLLGLLVINFELIASSSRWLLPAASTVAAVCFIVAALLQPQQQPKSNEIFYALNADTGKAVWATGDARPDEWTSQFLSTDATAAPLNDWLPWLDGAVFLQQPAPATTEPAPEIKVLDDQVQEQTRLIRMRVSSVREAATLFIYPGTEFSEAFVNGQALTKGPDAPALTKGQMLIYSAPPREGIELLLKTKSFEPLVLKVVDRSYEFPELTNLTVKARPNHIVPSPFSYSDSTFIGKTFSFAPAPAGNITSKY